MIEILCTLMGVLSGVAVVAALMQQQGDRAKFQAKETPSVDSEQIKGLTNQLQILTYRVAADVSAHNEKVVHINESLQPATKEPERIINAITELIHANESMQGQLAAAQMRLTQQTRQIEAAARQARTDALTGLANRRALDEYLKASIENTQEGVLQGLLLLDIDHFKSFNDSYGHTTGDAVLSSFARSISKWCNNQCYAARYGGEEFAVILSRKTLDELATAAGELRTYVSEQVISYEDLELTITSSAGLTLLQPGDTIQQVYERADEGLYRSKKGGRNCGHWLNNDQWEKLPAQYPEEPIAQVPLASSELLHLAGAKPAASPAVESATAPQSKPEKSLIAGDSPVSSGDKAATISQAKKSAGLEAVEAVTEGAIRTASAGEKTVANEQMDVLDLSTFVERVDIQLQQLGRADLPATAIVIEAIGVKTSADQAACWANTLSLVQSQIRGIDVMCRLRQHALCVFMPGCSLNAALERAGRMQSELDLLRQAANSGEYPPRLAISAGSAKINEGCGAFLQRLEYALEDAQDAKANEVVIHDGNSCYAQAT